MSSAVEPASIFGAFDKRRRGFRLAEQATILSFLADAGFLSDVAGGRSCSQFVANLRELYRNTSPLEWSSRYALVIEPYLRSVSAPPALLDESARIFGNIQDLCRQPACESYGYFLRAYLHLAELDDDSFASDIARSLECTQEIFPLTDRLQMWLSYLTDGVMPAGSMLSGYEAFQAVADYLRSLLRLDESPLDQIPRHFCPDLRFALATDSPR